MQAVKFSFAAAAWRERDRPGATYSARGNTSNTIERARARVWPCSYTLTLLPGVGLMAKAERNRGQHQLRRYKIETGLGMRRRVTSNWKRPAQRMLTSGKNTKRPCRPCKFRKTCGEETRFPYSSCCEGVRPPGPTTSSAVLPSALYKVKCARRNGSSSSLKGR